MSEEKKGYLTESALVASLAQAQLEMAGAKKESTNPHFNSKYADLESVTAAIKPIAGKYGLAYIQRFHDQDGGIAIETIILHVSGGQLSNGILRIPASKQDAQGYGSAITYARRYSLQAAFGIAPEDDDGNAAVDATKNHKPKTEPPQAKEKPEVGIWIDLIGKAAQKDINDFRDWYKGNEPDIIKDCGNDGAKKVYAAWVATGKKLTDGAS